MSRSYDERCQLYLESTRENKFLNGLLGPDLNIKRQKLQSETLALLSSHADDIGLQMRVLNLFWSKVCYSTITNIRKCRRQLKHGSAQEVECRNLLFSMFSFFQSLSEALVSNLIRYNQIIQIKCLE